MEVLGTLAAALLGALAGVVGQAWYTRRHDEAGVRAQRLAAARLVRGELQLATAALASAVHEDRWIVLEQLSVESWKLHGAQLTDLPSETFDLVASACTKVIGAGRHAELIGRAQRASVLPVSAKISKTASAVEATTRLVALCDAAITALGPVAYPDEELSPWPPQDRLAELPD